MMLRVDLVECPETGALVDFVLVDEHGHVIARLGPDLISSSEAEGWKMDLLDALGWKTGDRIRVEKEGA